MNKNKEEFVRAFRNQLAGMALFGFVAEKRETPLEHAARVLDIPDQVVKVLGAMYDYLARDDRPLAAKANGPRKAES